MARQVMDGSGPSDAEYLAARYAIVPDRVRKRRLVVVAVVIGLACVGWAAWIGTADGARVHAQTIGFDLQDGDGAQVTFDVSMDPGLEAVCTLRALNQRSVEVGLIDVRIPAATQLTQRVRAHLPTTEPAVTAMVKECALSSPDD